MGELEGVLFRELLSRELRRHPTDAERCLWQILRKHQLSNVHFRQQHAIGPFVVDFCAPSIKLIIEVDGGQHLDQKEYDSKRTAFLESKGYRVIRFWNHEVLNNLDAVANVITNAIDGTVA
jgi:very-short-patch-repair endonuclease